jgi:hypothetical protein
LYAEYVDNVYGAAFDSRKSFFDHASAANRSGLRNLAQTSAGRSFITEHLDIFYSLGWYAGNKYFKPRFESERFLYITNPTRNSLPACQKPN